MVPSLQGRTPEHIAVPGALYTEAIAAFRLSGNTGVLIPAAEGVHDLQVLQRRESGAQPVDGLFQMGGKFGCIERIVPDMGPPGRIQDPGAPVKISPHMTDTPQRRVLGVQ